MLVLYEAQQLLRAWASGTTDTPSNRFGAALRMTSPRGHSGSSDLAVLIRQVLRSNDAARLAYLRDTELDSLQSLERAWLDIPVTTLLPRSFPWGDFGLVSRTAADQAYVRVTADPWQPRWMGNEWHSGAADQDVAEERECRPEESVPGDPFLPLIDSGIDRYRTPGQRAAVRSAMVLPPGGTLVVNLPTGAGKTLAMLAPALRAPPTMTSVVVVPTVALALDHERRLATQRPGSPPTAYHGGLDVTQRAEFRSRLHNGQQSVLFTNPEALVSSLARPLTEVAAGGRLAMLAVDEAHIVASWGDAFRPQFHALAGLRTHLLRAANSAGHPAFRTILASATIAEDTLLLLRALFGEPGPFLQVAAPVVRSEPSFWCMTGVEPAERERCLLEALRQLPRPAIVYTTLRQEQGARPGTLTPGNIDRLLRQSGFTRVAVVDGGSSAAHRERVINGLRDDPSSPAEYDLVLATSAFGLGIDIPDIRSVIHACVPESLDRFYQEVGRGGRDGRASISVLLATKSDAEVASGLSAPTYITSTRARSRWTTMLGASESISDDLLRIPLTAAPSDVGGPSDYNERWNLFTVSLLARAGALAWDFDLPALPDDDLPLDDRGWLTVRILRGDHQSDEFWQDIAEPVRQQMVEVSGNSFRRLQEFLRGDRCAGELIAASYRITSPHEYRTVCLESCGGCLFCRRAQRSRWSSPSPTPAAIVGSNSESPTRLGRLATRGWLGSRLIVCAEPSTFERARRLRAAIGPIIANGSIELVTAPKTLMPTLLASLPTSDSGERTLMVDDLETFDPVLAIGVPTLIVLGTKVDSSRWLQGSARSPLFVILGTRDTAVGIESTLFNQDGSYTLADLERLL